MTEQPADEVLMLRYKDGDLGAIEMLVERHQRSLFHFIFRLCRDSELAQDLVQEVFLRLVRTARSYEPRAKFKTYLFTVAHNLCIDHLRRKKLRRNISLSDPVHDEDGLVVEDIMKDGNADPEKEYHQKSFREALQRAVDELPDEQREVFLLREQQNLPFDEIARIAGCLPSTAKSRMRYALQSIRQKLEKKFSLADIA